MYYCCGITDVGTVRDHNEDAFLINKTVVNSGMLESELDVPLIVAVADGVGGEAGGEIASNMALTHLSSVRLSENTDYKKKLLDIHYALHKDAETHNRINMQTTLCAMAVEKSGNAYIINVGDSKLLRYRGGSIRQLSRDQSLVQMLYENGEITADEKRTHKHRNVIFPVLGNFTEEPTIEVTPIEGGILAGDLILICSDGLFDYITKGDIEETLALPQKLPKRLKALTELAKSGGSTDNITVIGISVM